MVRKDKKCSRVKNKTSMWFTADIGIVPGNDISNPVRTCYRVLMDCRLYKEEHSLKKQTGNRILKMIAEHMEVFTYMM